MSIGPTKADTFTLSVGAGLPGHVSYQVPTNVVAQVISSRVYYSYLYVGFPGATNTLLYSADPVTSALLNPPTIVGPATMTLSNTWNPQFPSFCTIQTCSASSLSATPSTSVVIPADHGGPVTIILESSTDLIYWVAANPGTYGTTTSNRFFRVRAER